MKIIVCGINFQFETTGTTAPPGSNGLGGCMITAWVQIAGINQWHCTSWKNYDVENIIISFTNRKYLVQWLQNEFKVPHCLAI